MFLGCLGFVVSGFWFCLRSDYELVVYGCLGLFWCALGFALRVNCVYVYVGDCVCV